MVEDINRTISEKINSGIDQRFFWRNPAHLALLTERVGEILKDTQRRQPLDERDQSGFKNFRLFLESVGRTDCYRFVDGKVVRAYSNIDVIASESIQEAFAPRPPKFEVRKRLEMPIKVLNALERGVPHVAISDDALEMSIVLIEDLNKHFSQKASQTLHTSV